MITNSNNKPGSISKHEMAIIKMQPRTAYEILKGIQFPWPLAETIYQHYERLDGSGYRFSTNFKSVFMVAVLAFVFFMSFSFSGSSNKFVISCGDIRKRLLTI